MKNVLKVSHEKKAIVMDRTFAKRAENVRSDEYALLQTVRQDYPAYTVIRKTIKKNTSQERYRGLTYEFMEEYIEKHDPTGKVRAEYDEMRFLARGHSKRYPVIKQWFLKKFPEVVAYLPKSAAEDDEAEAIEEQATVTPINANEEAA